MHDVSCSGAWVAMARAIATGGRELVRDNYHLSLELGHETCGKRCREDTDVTNALTLI